MAQKLVDHNTDSPGVKPSVAGRPLVLGITGGIACGKSLIGGLFRELGAATVDADDLARTAVSPGSAAFTRIIEHFGREVLTAAGEIDRPQLAQRIFADPDERQVLNRITHPEIAALAIARLRELASRPDVPLVVYEAPLLFEAQAQDRVDCVLVVASAPEKQLVRLMQRDGVSRDEALRRIASQMPLAEKIARADFVIENNGTPEEAAQAVRAIFGKLTAHLKKNPPKAGDS